MPQNVPRETRPADLATAEGDLIPIADAAAQLGIPEKRLIGFIARNGVGDPIGDASHVYTWSLDSLRQRLADTSDALHNQGNDK